MGDYEGDQMARVRLAALLLLVAASAGMPDLKSHGEVEDFVQAEAGEEGAPSKSPAEEKREMDHVFNSFKVPDKFKWKTIPNEPEAEKHVWQDTGDFDNKHEAEFLKEDAAYAKQLHAEHVAAAEAKANKKYAQKDISAEEKATAAMLKLDKAADLAGKAIDKFGDE